MIIVTASIPHKTDQRLGFNELPIKGQYIDFGGADVYEVESVWHKYEYSDIDNDAVIPYFGDIRVVLKNPE